MLGELSEDILLSNISGERVGKTDEFVLRDGCTDMIVE